MAAIFESATVQADGRTVYVDFTSGSSDLVVNASVSGVSAMVRQGLGTHSPTVTALVDTGNLHRLVVSLPMPVLPGQDVYVYYAPGNLFDVTGAVAGVSMVRATNSSTVTPVITGADLSAIATRLRERIRGR